MSELLKSVWASLYAWAFPSAVAIAYYALLIYPEALSLHKYAPTEFEIDTKVAYLGLTAMIATCLAALRTPLYRILEGYLLWPRWLKAAGVKRHLRVKRAFDAAVRAGGSGWPFGLTLEDYARYPMRDDQIVPSKFGNAIRAFETYGKTRFNLDSQTLWHELYAVAPKYIQQKIEQAQSSVDFFVAGVFLSLFLAVATVVTGVLEDYDRTIFILAAPPLFVAFLSHWIAIRATDEWAYSVQALVNIGRVKLADSLGLSLPETLAEEREMWGLATKFVYFADADAGAGLNRFRRKSLAPADGEACAEDEPEAETPTED